MRRHAPFLLLVPAALAAALVVRGVVELALHAQVPAGATAWLAGGGAQESPAPAPTTKKRSLISGADPEEKPSDAIVPAVEPANCSIGRLVVAVADPIDPSRSMAVIAMPSATGTPNKPMVRPGGQLAGRRVLAITGSRVWLSSGRAACFVDASEQKDAKPEAKPTAATSAAKGIERVDDTHVRIDRTLRDQWMESGGADLAKSLRFSPETKDGKVVAMKIVSVDPKSALAKLGLKGGDVLKSVNGVAIGGPEQMFELYAKLRTAPHLEFELVRGGATVVVAADVI